MRLTLLTAMAAAAALSALTARAEIVQFSAALSGAAETPATASAGKGTASVTLDTDTRRVTWTITYAGLSGPATMAHFHGPAAPGASAGVLIPVAGSLASPIKGEADVDDGQIGDLRAGLWYVNIHTAQNPKGEIRGQLQQAK